MHNLGTVFRFEVTRALKKKTFWITALAFPIIIGVVFAIIFFSNEASQQAAQEAQTQTFSIAITDNSGVIDKSLLDKFKATEIASKQEGMQKVQQGTLDAYFYYPARLEDEKVEVYAKDVGIFDNSRYQGVAETLLQESVKQTINPTTVAILQDKLQFNVATYQNGQVRDNFRELLAPGIFLVLFYIVIAMFGNQMLTSTTEEKENRVIEMILTTIEARTLIVGKILSLITLAFIQIAVILLPVLIAHSLLHEQLALPAFDLSNIPLDWGRIVTGAVLFLLSFLLFTGILVAIGAVAPTAKEAASFFGVIMLLLFGPLYAVTLFVSAPESLVVKVLSFFPLTAPIPLLLRNAVGNLSFIEVLIAIVMLAACATLALAASVRLFRYGALEYSKRLSLKLLFQKPSKM